MSSFLINIRIHKLHIAWNRKNADSQGWKGIGRLRFSVNKNYKKEWGLFDIYM